MKRRAAGGSLDSEEAGGMRADNAWWMGRRLIAGRCQRRVSPSSRPPVARDDTTRGRAVARTSSLADLRPGNWVTSRMYTTRKWKLSPRDFICLLKNIFSRAWSIGSGCSRRVHDDKQLTHSIYTDKNKVVVSM